MVHLSAVPAVAIALGAVLGLGLWLVAASAPRLGRARLVDRVAPYITDFSAEARAMRSRPDADPASVIGMLVLPAIRRLRSIVGSVLGGNDTIARRLRQAGSASAPASDRIASWYSASTRACKGNHAAGTTLQTWRRSPDDRAIIPASWRAAFPR